MSHGKCLAKALSALQAARLVEKGERLLGIEKVRMGGQSRASDYLNKGALDE
jgi:hypothetical protein